MVVSLNENSFQELEIGRRDVEEREQQGIWQEPAGRRRGGYRGDRQQYGDVTSAARSTMRLKPMNGAARSETKMKREPSLSR